MKNLYRGSKKMNLIGIFVSILIILTIVIPVVATTNRQVFSKTAYDVDVPVWENGDEWTYHFTESRTINPAYSFSDDITYKIIEDSGDSYTLKAKVRPKGSFDLGSIGLKTTMFTSGFMEIQLRKADLGLENFVEKLKGILLLTIGSLTLPIPIQISANYNVEFDPTWVIIPFPLYDGKCGNLSSTEILHINDTIHLFWKLITVFGPLSEALPLSPIPYTCNLEKLTVGERTFDVYNVSAGLEKDWRFISYYSEEVGNVVKEVIYIPAGGGKVINSYILELKDWSYTP